MESRAADDDDDEEEEEEEEERLCLRLETRERERPVAANEFQ